MAIETKIEWAHHTANLWWGCTKVHRGCDNCYAEAWATRWGQDIWTDQKPRLAIKSVWADLNRMQREAAAANTVQRVFVGSMMDIFEKNKPLVTREGDPLGITTGQLRERLFREVIPNSPNLMFLLLTKRPSNINKMIPPGWQRMPLPNVMYGASVVDQPTANTVARQLSEVNGPTFWSMEPLLEQVSLVESCRKYRTPDWVIVGGESGPNRRPFDPDWARIIRAECEDMHIPFFMKQWDKVRPVPEDLLVRELPSFDIHVTATKRLQCQSYPWLEPILNDPSFTCKLTDNELSYIQQLPKYIEPGQVFACHPIYDDRKQMYSDFRALPFSNVLCRKYKLYC